MPPREPWPMFCHLLGTALLSQAHRAQRFDRKHRSMGMIHQQTAIVLGRISALTQEPFAWLLVDRTPVLFAFLSELDSEILEVARDYARVLRPQRAEGSGWASEMTSK